MSTNRPSCHLVLPHGTVYHVFLCPISHFPVACLCKCCEVIRMCAKGGSVLRLCEPNGLIVPLLFTGLDRSGLLLSLHNNVCWIDAGLVYLSVTVSQCAVIGSLSVFERGILQPAGQNSVLAQCRQWTLQKMQCNTGQSYIKPFLLVGSQRKIVLSQSRVFFYHIHKHRIWWITQFCLI